MRALAQHASVSSTEVSENRILGSNAYSGENSLHRGIPALDAGYKKFNSRLVAPT